MKTNQVLGPFSKKQDANKEDYVGKFAQGSKYWREI